MCYQVTELLYNSPVPGAAKGHQLQGSPAPAGITAPHQLQGSPAPEGITVPHRDRKFNLMGIY